MGVYFTNELEEKIKKSELYMQIPSDFEELENMGTFFLDCHMEEEKETVVCRYDMEGKKSFHCLREEKKMDKLRVLLEVEKLAAYFEKYCFSISPDNLYYDRNCRVYVKRRELYEPGMVGNIDDMTEQYRALTAHVLQKKYTFDDYYLGGSDLYKKDRHLKELRFAESISELVQWLETSYEKEYDAVFHKRVEVNRVWYRMNRGYMVVTMFLIVVAAIAILYTIGGVLPRKNAILQAQNSYLDEKYVQVIDDLSSIDLKYMDKYIKYILAVSYVKGENLTPEQKENVLETISIDGEEKQKEYWIYLGRLNTLEAENIAMQRSDDELLLYAYMKEKVLLERDTHISGEEKASQLEALNQKIEELAEKYQLEEEQ